MPVSPNTDTLRRVLDLIDEEGEALEVGGKRRRARRLRRRTARRQRRAQRRQAKDRRQTTRLADRSNRQADRQDARQERQQTVRDGRADRQDARLDNRQQARELRASRGQMDEQPEDLELAQPDEAVEDFEEMVDDDVEEMAELQDALVDNEVIDAALDQLDGIAGALEDGRLAPKKALLRARRTRQEAMRLLKAHDRGRPERRNALRRRTVQSMQSQLSGFGAEPTCSACTEAYGRALLAGLELAGRQAEVELGFSPFNVFKKAGKKVGKTAEQLARKNEQKPTRAVEERQREGGRKLFDVLRRRKKNGAAPMPGAEVAIGPDIRMRTVGNRKGVVLDLGDGVYLVTAAEQTADVRALRTRLLSVGRRQIDAINSPVGLLQGA